MSQLSLEDIEKLAEGMGCKVKADGYFENAVNFFGRN
jgi:hypothetical protein